EVAEESRVSVTWYTWLEQGREIRPSPEALQRIAKVLELNATEQEYLFRLAGVASSTGAQLSLNPAHAPLFRTLDSLGTPAVILDEGLVPVRWNSAFRDLLLDLEPHAAEGRNWMEILFCEQAVR